jgi:hypothetical protein
MSKSCLRPNLIGPNLVGLRSTRVIEMLCILSTRTLCPKGSESYSICFLWLLIFWLMGVVAVEGKITPPSQTTTLVENRSARDNSRHSEMNRRDPFERIKKRMPTSMVPKKSHTESTIVPRVEDPVWRLLAVIHGQDGHQAVIQLSPKERVVVQPGSELGRSGWTIKTINEGEVFLEHLSAKSSVGVYSPPRKLTLSFPPIRKSP